jgi:RNase H-fold protein (predicted Holliday junction resolvase)
MLWFGYAVTVQQKQQYLVGFDPGREKCGVAIMTGDRSVVWHQVIPSAKALASLRELHSKYPFSLIVIGDQTGSKHWKSQLQAQFPDLQITTVPEQFTSQLARERYWQMYPPQGWQKLVPLGMRVPPRPIDDIVAIILLERWLL